ncbi:DUF3103 family protein [uncultured Shewanella sp.]|uniref:DUF3103 family protein n=1 Tax=uncultured Shewanella sp. TaxID=173975 RepID=UPI00262F307A|nr:DUF3103 family protein [uncultured Shewanella sp.]
MKCFSIAVFSVTFSLNIFCFNVGANERNINSVDDLFTHSLTSHSVEKNKRAIARALALNYVHIAKGISYYITEYNLSMPVNEIDGLPIATVANIDDYSININQLKGINSQANDKPSEVVQIRLADESMLVQLQAGEVPLFVFSSNDEGDGNIEAFGADGRVEYLDAYRLPTQPVFIVELNKEKTIKAGLEAMNAIFDQVEGQITSSERRLLSNQPTSMVAEPLSMTVIKNIEVQKIKESWISGPAEVYAIITGVNASGDELTPKIDVVELPYLDKAQKEYTPNQIIVQWDNYRWQAVDILLMESDDNINYKALATALLNVATQVLQFIPETTTQTAAIITRLTNAVIQAMPDSWTTNEDDFIDVFYTIFEGESYSEYQGASQNAKMTLAPLVIRPRG